jgi:anti-anti-sigma factor
VNPAPFEASAAQLDDGIRIVAVRGELDLSTAPELEGPLQEAVTAGDAPVVVDLSECAFIDSTGIALIVRAWKQLDGAVNGDGPQRIVICGCNDQVGRVLEITGLGTSIPIHDSRDEALAALRG